MPETRPLIDRLRPYEKLILRLEEIFLLKRPLIFGLILILVLGTAISIKSYECGVFATITLILIVIYTIAIVWVYFGNKLEPRLFPELSQEKLQQGAKFYTLDQLVEIINAHCSNDKPQARSTTSSAIFAAVCFALAFLFKFVNEFYLSLFLVILLLFTPFIVSLPAVMQIIHKGKMPSLAER